MIYLLLATLIWAFSFGLIKGSLTGIDPNLLSTLRLLISFLIFLPFLRPTCISIIRKVQLMAIGAIQFGIMYIAYIQSYQYLQGHEIAILTLTTPLIITLTSDLFELKIDLKHLLLSILAVIGAGVVVYKGHTPSWGKGLILVQLSNMAFGVGQVLYKKIKQKTEGSDHSIFAILYFGSVILTITNTTLLGRWSGVMFISSKQWWIITYLGIVASGIGFFLWNKGVVKTKITTIAIMNNCKIPAAVAIAIVFFNEKANILKSLSGIFIIILAIILSEKMNKQK